VTDVTALARELGVDEETVQTILAFAAKGEKQDLPDEVDGLASCINQMCDRFNEDRPIRLKIDRVSRSYKDQGGDLGFESTSTEYTHPADDADLACPECGQPCALIPGARPVIPNHTRNMVMSR
jgi:transposase